MNKTAIEWVVNPDGSQGFTWNPIVGCTNGCSYCYARRTAKRFTNCQQCVDFFPHLHEERLEQPLKRRKPATIFLGSMCDLWDPNVPLAWRQQIWDVVKQTPQHTYLVLTKQPQNFTREEDGIFDCLNFWIGVTVTSQDDAWRMDCLFGEWAAENRFMSFEPLLNGVDTWGHHPDWAIIGSQTGPILQPAVRWVYHILDGLPHTPIFAKDNLNWPAELGPKPRELPYLNDKS